MDRKDLRGWGGCARGFAKEEFRHYVLPIFLSLFIISCVGFSRSEVPLTRPGSQYLKCNYIQADDRSERRLLKCSFGFDQCNIFTATGKKLVIEAESGERLELFWTVDWFGLGKIFPHWLYVLEYVEPDGRGGYLPAVRIGECHFSDGCNRGEFLAPDVNGNGVPDRFTWISWESWDYGNDKGVRSYLDMIRHLYVRETDRYTVTRYLYDYPAACKPPLGSRDDVCSIKAECRPPYRLAREERLESRFLHTTSGERQL